MPDEPAPRTRRQARGSVPVRFSLRTRPEVLAWLQAEAERRNATISFVATECFLKCRDEEA